MDGLLDALRCLFEKWGERVRRIGDHRSVKYQYSRSDGIMLGSAYTRERKK